MMFLRPYSRSKGLPYLISHTVLHTQQLAELRRMSPSAVERLSRHFWTSSCHLFYCRAVSPALFIYCIANHHWGFMGLYVHVCVGAGGEKDTVCYAGVSYVWAAFFLLPSAYFWSLSGKWRHVSAPTRPLCFLQVDSITSMLRGEKVAQAFEQTKCFTPGRGLQGTRFWSLNILFSHRSSSGQNIQVGLVWWNNTFLSKSDIAEWEKKGLSFNGLAVWAMQGCTYLRNMGRWEKTEHHWKCHCHRLHAGAATSCCVTSVCECAQMWLHRRGGGTIVVEFQLLKRTKKSQIPIHFLLMALKTPLHNGALTSTLPLV